MELSVSLGAAHPLAPPRVAAAAPAPAPNTHWLAVYLAYQNGTVLSALRMWMDAVARRVEAAPQCYICYCRLHPATGRLPKVPCHQCPAPVRNKFHAHCLVSATSATAPAPRHRPPAQGALPPVPQQVPRALPGECYICYCRLHPATGRLPKVPCHQCRNKFHAHCLCYICYCRLHPATGRLPKVPCHQCRNKFHAHCLVSATSATAACTPPPAACPRCPAPVPQQVPRALPGECYICYCRLHPATGRLPKVPCHQCRNKFHAHCLVSATSATAACTRHRPPAQGALPPVPQQVPRALPGECYICYCRLHPATGRLPKVPCHQCRNKFHAHCLCRNKFHAHCLVSATSATAACTRHRPPAQVPCHQCRNKFHAHCLVSATSATAACTPPPAACPRCPATSALPPVPQQVPRALPGECYICYCRLHPATGRLPKVPCHQCRNKFHAHCLRKWFTSSSKSNCPLCRAVF
ncbi:hypothetical protein MSG28_003905 [Choristoneura fumiferana]|uniref:Uncharacterized protein n=1 Tax=Choristoneura fumiferana TaxID=7141 RepID=A0ACC0KH54_CHOFU|nr:hypothetical protein MSG28_003905 [Choristoneura fumiferana]